MAILLRKVSKLSYNFITYKYNDFYVLLVEFELQFNKLDLTGGVTGFVITVKVTGVSVR